MRVGRAKVVTLSTPRGGAVDTGELGGVEVGGSAAAIGVRCIGGCAREAAHEVRGRDEVASEVPDRAGWAVGIPINSLQEQGRTWASSGGPANGK